MKDWIDIREGKYRAMQTLLVSADNVAVEMAETVIHIYKDRQGVLRLQGQGFVNSLAIIELLEDHDDLNIILDMGGEFKYRLSAPTLSGGKIFSPDVKSSMVFIPTRPWVQLTEAEYTEYVASLKLAT